MRNLRSLVILVCLCLFLGVSVASAAEAPAPPANREADGLARIVGQIGALLKSVWASEAGEIDPLGRNSPTAGAPAGDGSATASADEAGIIDPWGGWGR